MTASTCILCIYVNELKVLQLSDQHQIIENNQIPQIIYQQNSQPNPIQTADGQVHYIVKEEDLQNDNYNLVQQATQQVFYHKIENGQQIIQHHGKYDAEVNALSMPKFGM